MVLDLLFLLLSILMIMLLDLNDKLAQMKRVAAAREREIRAIKDAYDIELRRQLAWSNGLVDMLLKGQK